MISMLYSVLIDVHINGYFILEVLTEGVNMYQKASTFHNYGQCCVISLYRFHSCSKIEPVNKIISPDHVIVM
jgi:hypothetical protein